MPRGFCQTARSISFLSPIASLPLAPLAMNIASLILRPERLFLAVTSFQRLIRPSFSLGSSSLISRRRQSLSDSRALAAAREHPQAVRPAPDQQSLAALGGDQLERLRHVRRNREQNRAHGNLSSRIDKFRGP